jgi:hypothetical protein
MNEKVDLANSITVDASRYSITFNLRMNSPNRVPFRHLPDPNKQSSLSLRLNEFFQLLFPPSQNYFLFFSLFSPFSPLHHRIFDHIIPLTLISSRFFIVFKELTGNFDFLIEFLSVWAIRFSRTNIRNFISNKNSDFLLIEDQSDFRVDRPYHPFSGRMSKLIMRTQACKEFTKIDKRVRQEISVRKFKSNSLNGQIICFGINLCRFVQKFNCFELSELQSIEMIFCTKHIFPDVSTLCPYFESSLIFIPHYNVHFNFNFDLNFRSFCEKEARMRTIKSIFLIKKNGETDCHRFYCNVVDEHESESSVQRNGHFFSSTFLIEIERFFGQDHQRSENSNIRIFWLNENETENENEKEKVNKNDSIMSEMDEIRRLLSLSGGSKNESTEVVEIEDSVEIVRTENFQNCSSLKAVLFSSGSQLRDIFGFCRCTSLCRIEIPSSVERIGFNGFTHCTSLKEIIFSSDSHLREISGFQGCTSISRIEIPSSVERIGFNGFMNCTSLNEIIFSSDSHLREIFGLQECTSLCRIEIPSSVEKIGFFGFSGCRSLHVFIIRPGCRIRENKGLRNIKPFLRYEDVDVKECRRLVHLGVGGR